MKIYSVKWTAWEWADVLECLHLHSTTDESVSLTFVSPQTSLLRAAKRESKRIFPPGFLSNVFNDVKEYNYSKLYQTAAYYSIPWNHLSGITWQTKRSRWLLLFNCLQKHLYTNWFATLNSKFIQILTQVIPKRCSCRVRQSSFQFIHWDTAGFATFSLKQKWYHDTHVNLKRSIVDEPEELSNVPHVFDVSSSVAVFLKSSSLYSH